VVRRGFTRALDGPLFNGFKILRAVTGTVVTGVDEEGVMQARVVVPKSPSDVPPLFTVGNDEGMQRTFFGTGTSSFDSFKGCSN